MDQLRVALRWLKQYHFWLLAVLALVLGTGSWFSAVGTVSQEFEGYKGQVGQAFQETSKVVNSLNHPNTLTDQKMAALINGRARDVRDAWQLKWERQGEILTWPAELKDDFLEKVKGMRLIERVDPEANPEDEMRISLRERYRDYIKYELPKLARDIGARWDVSATAADSGFSTHVGVGFSSTSRPSAQTAAPADDSIVHWNPSNQADLQARHFDWSAQPDRAPSTRQVLYSQEDLWVLRTLMKVIKNTNGPVEARHQAAIKEIDFIQLGRNAVARAGAVIQIGPAPKEEEGEVGVAQLTPVEDQLQVDPAEGRYVDKNYLPLTAESLRAAAQSENPEEAYLAVAKRMPIRMRLVMDTRRIDKLLAECGNSPLTVEVRQLRLNRPPAGGGADTTGQDSSTTTPAGSDAGSDQRALYDRPVELYGIVYIFNPVDEAKLGLNIEDLVGAAPPREVARSAAPQNVR